MDLFAREFILPRPVAQQLHLVDAMTASQIAERLAAPIDVVALQLLDGLLLPRVELTSAEPGAEKQLNAEQAKAAAHRGSPFLLEAGPGTGKTQTLVARVGDLLAQGVDASTILILTFRTRPRENSPNVSLRNGRRRRLLPGSARSMPLAWTSFVGSTINWGSRLIQG